MVVQLGLQLVMEMGEGRPGYCQPWGLSGGAWEVGWIYVSAGKRGSSAGELL